MREVVTNAMRPVWAEVSASKLTRNLRAVQATAGVDVLAVVKADGYGHGAVECAPVLAAAGAKWLGVTSVEEGVRVRQALGILPQGIAPRVLVMCGVWAGEAVAAIRYALTPVVWEPYHLDLMEAEAKKLGLRDVAVHVEVDTGMARQGVRPGAQMAALLQRFGPESRLKLEGVMSHLASAEIVHGAQTESQMARFACALEQVRETGLRPALVHVGNTSAVDCGVVMPQLRVMAESLGAMPMTRAGLALYGYALDLEGGAPELHPEPVMTWKTRVVSLREVQAGDHVGYGGTFTAVKTMRLALLPVGYADGLRRELSSPAGAVLLHGRRAAVVGRVSMDLTIVDVTEIPGVEIGEEAVLIGAQGAERIGAEEHARWAETIPYEIICGISERVSRVIVD
ncbi:alanine racemase [Terriglobus saanensis SP1PR4]|uniref:Alanine racemase n=1 Tax=Terriglobus saanensis (strain ATCC BAA-1853 / DSM 23119 / SP1PR4) TaxID=401053 RepID=E8V4K0_TERSS|nr:alanine racemase [Terriglobus saanensis SP1PR4]